MSTGKVQPIHYDRDTVKELTKQVCTIWSLLYELCYYLLLLWCDFLMNSFTNKYSINRRLNYYQQE